MEKKTSNNAVIFWKEKQGRKGPWFGLAKFHRYVRSSDKTEDAE